MSRRPQSSSHKCQVQVGPAYDNPRPANPKEIYTSSLNTECSLCLDDMNDADQMYYVSPCQHVFHRDCIMPVVNNPNPLCPLCRTPINKFLTKYSKDMQRISDRNWNAPYIGAPLVRNPLQDHQMRMIRVNKEREEREEKKRKLEKEREWHKAELDKLDKMLEEMLTW